MRMLRFAVRQLARNPIFGAVVVLSLAVGIGANTALFSLVDAMVLRKLPVAEPDELVYLEWSFTGELEVSVNGNISRDVDTNALTATSFAYDTYQELRASSRTLEPVFAFAPTYRSIVNIDGQPETLPSQLVSGNYFSALGVNARIGRTITDADDAEANPVAVISDRYWERRFARDPSVVGKDDCVERQSVDDRRRVAAEISRHAGLRPAGRHLVSAQPRGRAQAADARDAEQDRLVAAHHGQAGARRDA